jgi:hypothetical protein
MAAQRGRERMKAVTPHGQGIIFVLAALLTFALLVSLATHDVNKPVSPSTLPDSVCGYPLSHVVSVTLVASYSYDSIYKYVCADYIQGMIAK